MSPRAGRGRADPDVETVPAASLVEDFALYPRHDVDGSHVADLARALRAGVVLPPVVADRATRRLADGWHRRRAAIRVHGAEAPIAVRFRDYADEAALFADAVELNSQHGRRLDRQDQIRVTVLASGSGWTRRRSGPSCTSSRGGAAAARPGGLRGGRGPAGAGQAGGRAPSGPDPDGRTGAAMKTFCGVRLSQQMTQLLGAVESGLLDLTDERLCRRLHRLARAIQERCRSLRLRGRRQRCNAEERTTADISGPGCGMAGRRGRVKRRRGPGGDGRGGGAGMARVGRRGLGGSGGVARAGRAARGGRGVAGWARRGARTGLGRRGEARGRGRRGEAWGGRWGKARMGKGRGGWPGAGRGGLACRGVVRPVGLGLARGGARGGLGRAAGRGGTGWEGVAGHGVVRPVRQGQGRRGEARVGRAWRGRFGTGRQGSARPGGARPVRCGKARGGLGWLGEAGARPGGAIQLLHAHDPVTGAWLWVAASRATPASGTCSGRAGTGAGGAAARPPATETSAPTRRRFTPSCVPAAVKALSCRRATKWRRVTRPGGGRADAGDHGAGAWPRPPGGAAAGAPGTGGAATSTPRRCGARSSSCWRRLTGRMTRSGSCARRPVRSASTGCWRTPTGATSSRGRTSAWPPTALGPGTQPGAAGGGGPGAAGPQAQGPAGARGPPPAADPGRAAQGPLPGVGDAGVGVQPAAPQARPPRPPGKGGLRRPDVQAAAELAGHRPPFSGVLVDPMNIARLVVSRLEPPQQEELIDLVRHPERIPDPEHGKNPYWTAYRERTTPPEVLAEQRARKAAELRPAGRRPWRPVPSGDGRNGRRNGPRRRPWGCPPSRWTSRPPDDAPPQDPVRPGPRAHARQHPYPPRTGGHARAGRAGGRTPGPGTSGTTAPPGRRVPDDHFRTGVWAPSGPLAGHAHLPGLRPPQRDLGGVPGAPPGVPPARRDRG